MFEPERINRRYATKPVNYRIPALKRRANFMLTLRVEDITQGFFQGLAILSEKG
jgi:hypothetical protein